MIVFPLIPHYMADPKDIFILLLVLSHIFCWHCLMYTNNGMLWVEYIGSYYPFMVGNLWPISIKKFCRKYVDL